jgi:hypothetical protein
MLAARLNYAVCTMYLNLQRGAFPPPFFLCVYDKMTVRMEEAVSRLETIYYYSVYLLYWYKSANTDAAGESFFCCAL